ncbi:hypothetical protein [Inquilinus sp. OTU3971]|uniref:hypothetical protein n=1 Tax=Inquilinus sp. OTU3971 TaxID=3043855 RepID=UPI00313A7A57
MTGAPLALAISPDRPDRCPALALAVGDARILWLGFEPASQAPQASPARNLVIRLIGPVPGHSDDPVTISEIELDDGRAPDAGPMLPVGPDLLDQARPWAVGRAALGKAGPGTVTAECAAGTAGGSAVVELPGHLPRGARLALAAEYDADALFDLALGSRDKPLGRLPPGTGRQAVVPLPGDRDAPVVATIRCPPGPARISLRSLRLSGGEARPVPLSTWVWRPAQWRDDGDGLIAAARARGLDRIFIGLDIGDGAVADAGRLRSFLQAARAVGLSVWAVEGDPAAITKAGRPPFLERTRAIAAFNRGGSPALDGIQYDIEPYLLPGWPLDRAAGIAAYLDTLERLKRDAAGPVEAVLPFWWLEMPEMAGSLDRLAAAADRFAVMAYRTRPDDIVAAAESALAWAGAHDRPMTVALEAGPLPDDRVQTFRPAAEGELWRVALDGRRILVLLDRRRANPAGQAYRRQGDHRLPAGRLSFLGDAAALTAATDRVRPVLSAWPAFAGIAVHGLLDGPSARKEP